MIKRMLIMLVCVGLVFGGIFAYRAYRQRSTAAKMGAGPPPVTVSTMRAEFQDWQPTIKAVGTFQAVQGVDVTTEVAGLVQEIHFQSGDPVQKSQVLVQLNAEADIALLHSLEAEAELARTTYERDRQEFKAQAISRAVLDVSAADLKSKKAQVAQQAAIVRKKTIRAPFAGRLGISSVDLGQYLSPGQKIVSLQALDPIYLEFWIPQQEIDRIALGQTVGAETDTYPGRVYEGKVTAVNPLVDPQTRNVQVEATLENPRYELLPGMFASVEIKTGAPERRLTLPQTAVTYNPYGETVYVVKETGKGPQGAPILTARQTFVTVGSTRGDQVAILKGIQEGDTVVTSGQLKLRSGSRVVVNNQVQPSSAAAPQVQDE